MSEKDELTLEEQQVRDSDITQKVVARLEQLRHSGENVIRIYWLEKTAESTCFEMYDAAEFPLTWVTKIHKAWGKK